MLLLRLLASEKNRANIKKVAITGEIFKDFLLWEVLSSDPVLYAILLSLYVTLLKRHSQQTIMFFLLAHLTVMFYF